jgi:hypothetical protein
MAFQAAEKTGAPLQCAAPFLTVEVFRPLPDIFKKNAKFCAALGSMRPLIWASGRPVLVRQFVRVLED